MPAYAPYLKRDWRPLANPDAMVRIGQARFTVLTERLIRLEWSADGRFEDRPSQPFWFREQPLVSFSAETHANTLTLITSHLELIYDSSADGFSAEALRITLLESGTRWQPGADDSGNLLGTTRTLDNVDGGTKLEKGLLSRDGWVLVDDSATLVFTAEGWLTPREPERIDQYFFGYGHDFQACLRDYQVLTGSVPLLPRWALGNWWSRYWAYTEEELRTVVEDFRAHEVPLSVCIIDMDWHLVNVGENINGWTGYTWNRELFPDPPGFIDWLHQQGLHTALNLHPALGIRPHEAAYGAMAERLGRDPASAETIPFDIASPVFTEAYFAELHHPLEAQGVDFWWLDWQQGEQSKLPGLDPLWWLNHLHFYDLGRDPQVRPFIFSRWGGLGNHRYPIGFSGDTHVTWQSLAFQPRFTTTAANVCYGWWSHDIGGHYMGTEDPELYARWVQFGVFSPILRLHSSNNPFLERRPFAYEPTIFEATRDAMQLRHSLIPYLYTLAHRNHSAAIAPIRPLYHDYPTRDEAYDCPQQMTFGDDLIVLPFTSPRAEDTGLSREECWLPPGEWFDFFSGETLDGDRVHAIYGGLDRLPVFARAGAIVPLGPKVGWGGVENPFELDVHLFAGADGQFTLYEDDGTTQAYLDGAFGQMAFGQKWADDVLSVTVSAVVGDRSVVPAARRLRLHIFGVAAPDGVVAEVGGESAEVYTDYDPISEILFIDGLILPSDQALELRLTRSAGLRSRRERTAETVEELLWAFKLQTLAKSMLMEQLDDIRAEPDKLEPFGMVLTDGQMQALRELLFANSAA